MIGIGTPSSHKRMDRIFAPFNFQKRVAIFGEFLQEIVQMGAIQPTEITQ